MSNLSQQFLIQLKERIKHLPEAEVLKVLSYYSEMIEDRMEDGMEEEVAIKSLGKIDDIVASIEEEIPLSSIVKEKVQKQVEEKAKMSNERKFLIIILVFITSPIWVSLLFGVLAGVVGLVFGLWGAYIAIICSYLASTLFLGLGSLVEGLFNIITFDFLQGISQIGLGFVGVGAFILLLKPVIWLSKKWIDINIWPFKKLRKKLTQVV